MLWFFTKIILWIAVILYAIKTIVYIFNELSNAFGTFRRSDPKESDPDFNRNPNKRGSDAWWAEQEKFINESLYVNHDWDIFKREEERCDAKHCHNPYHHHKK